MKAVAGQMRLDLAQYRELAAFAQFGTELDRTTQAALERGARLVEVLKQPQHTPIPLEDQVALFYAATRGYLDDLPVEAIGDFEQQLIAFLRSNRQRLRNAIVLQNALTPEIEQMLTEAIEEFKRSEFLWEK
ncbi:MAG: F0F1 ATP synthase subunit alpha, partial [Chloroflexi bacterium]|nr:F0F1 ATP synthase subunit alpha [Chloroflexota bacterium]